MSPVPRPQKSRTLGFLAAFFIVSFFFFFTYSGLFAYFTFDDGTTIFACLKPFEVSVWRDILHILTVFTAAFRPLTTMFWRPLYAVFGFNPLPYRIAVHLLLLLNIGIAYAFARRLDATREAALLTALVYSYNGAMSALLYDTCLIGDIACFSLYAMAVMTYVRGRQNSNPLSWPRIAAVSALYALALDSKELAVTLPGVLVIYELLYRRHDFRDRRKALRLTAFLALLFVAAAVYLKVKVPDMSQNAAYHPHVTVGFVLKNLAHYVQELFYFPENSVSPLQACLIVGGILAVCVLIRSRQAIFGLLFFLTAMVPVAVIPVRGSYAVYLAYFGLALTVGSLFANIRVHLTRIARLENRESQVAIVFFVCFAVLLGWAHLIRHESANGYFEWDKPKLITLMNYFRDSIPEFPPGARVLVTDNVWPPDYGLMFLLRYMYHDNTLWVDRPNTMDRPPDLGSYDLVVNYKAPDIDMQPARFLGFKLKWEPRGYMVNSGQFEASSPNARGRATQIDFTPQAVRNHRNTTVKIPGLSNVSVNAIYRIVSEHKSKCYRVNDWCKLDANGTCTITAPSVATLGSMVIDWIQPVNERWIFTGGVLTIVK
jgi:hypothetical protein